MDKLKKIEVEEVKGHKAKAQADNVSQDALRKVSKCFFVSAINARPNKQTNQNNT